MEASRGAIVAGERKTVTSCRNRAGEEAKAAVRREALILGLEKPASGELNSEAPGAPERDVQCGACPR